MAAKVVSDRIVSVPFRVVATSTISKTANTTLVTELELKPANLGTRVAAIGACFEYFKIPKLRLKMFSDVVGPTHYDSSILNVTLGTIGGSMAIGYEPSDTSRTGVPTTFNEIIQAAEADCGSLYEKISFAVPGKVLLGTPVKWFDTGSTGSPPSGNQVQGLIWTLTKNQETNDAAIGNNVFVLLEGMIEFRGMIPPALSSKSPTVKSLDDEKDTISQRSWVVQRPLAGSNPEPELRTPLASPKSITPGGPCVASSVCFP